jgi:antitoxin VapB
MDRRTEIQIKQDRVNGYLNSRQLDGVYLTSVANFAWFTGGGDSHVENHSKFGVASLLLTKSKRFLLTNNIEMERILTEQLSDAADLFEPVVYDWFDPEGETAVLEDLTRGLAVEADAPVGGLAHLEPDFSALRYTLTESEVERCRWLGATTAEAVEAAARAITPGMAEFEIEAVMSSEITRRGIQPVVLLVAGDERNQRYRHPVPSGQVFTRFAKLVCCARKWGLITALTRCVYVGQIPDDLRKKQQDVAAVDAAYLHATRPGATAGDIIEAGQAAYQAAGYPEEWRRHHQGGAIGYEAREYIAVSGSREMVRSPQAFAWNPSIHGNKSEDTILVSEAGLEVTTATGRWPTIPIDVQGETYHRPDILVH